MLFMLTVALSCFGCVLLLKGIKLDLKALSMLYTLFYIKYIDALSISLYILTQLALAMP